jgi:clan AA aspartic protease (TIGR02281 family)
MTKRKEMWLIAALLAGVSAPAIAEMDCGMPVVKIGKDTGRNPVVSVQIGRDPSGAWHVNHKLADGTIIYREQQYDITDISENGTYVWQGSNRRNPWIWMRGETKTVNGRPGYVESLYDAHQGNRLVMYSEVQCLDPIDPRKYAAPKPPVYEAYVPPQTSNGLIVLLTSDGIGGHKIDVTLGTNISATMLLDTGATMVAVPQEIADQLINIGEAVVVTQQRFTIADGTTSTQNVIDIGKFTIGGRTLYHVRAGVGPSGSPMLLGTNVLNRFGKYSIDATNDQLILG